MGLEGVVLRPALLTAILFGCLVGCATENATVVPGNEPTSQLKQSPDGESASEMEPTSQVDPASQLEIDKAVCREEADRTNRSLGESRVMTELFGLSPEMQKVYDSCMVRHAY
jgi:hypothetical protein